MNQNNFRRLHFFTPFYGDANVLLAHTRHWIEELSKYFDQVIVYAVHVDPAVTHRKNILVHELGGGNFKDRLWSLLRITMFALKILTQRDKPYVFYHMLPQPAIIVGSLLKLRESLQVLWYSHSSITLALLFTEKIVDLIVTPTNQSFPIKSRKVQSVGHAIPISKFYSEKLHLNRIRLEQVLYVGRLSAIKRLEQVIYAMSKSKAGIRRILAVGPVLDEDYKKQLQTLSEELEIELKFKEEVMFSEVESVMLESLFFFSGNPKTLDKSSVQSAISGCWVLSEESHVLEAVGMKMIWEELGVSALPRLENQIEILNGLTKLESKKYRKKLMNFAFEHNRLDYTIKRIVELMR